MYKDQRMMLRLRAGIGAESHTPQRKVEMRAMEAMRAGRSSVLRGVTLGEEPVGPVRPLPIFAGKRGIPIS
jgi:hypothetical protein